MGLRLAHRLRRRATLATCVVETILGFEEGKDVDRADRCHRAEFCLIRARRRLPAGAVLDELRQEGVNVTPDVAEATVRGAEAAWKEGGARSAT